MADSLNKQERMRRHEKKRVMREALYAEAVRRCAPGGESEGSTPEELLRPLAERLWSMAMDGEATPVTLGAIKEISDRLEGKPVQETVSEGTVTHGVDAGLLGFASDLLKKLPAQKRLEKVVNESGDEPDSA